MVVVKTPYGEIPWSGLSRLSDEEMKLVMRDAVNKTYRFLCRLFDEKVGGELILRLAEGVSRKLGGIGDILRAHGRRRTTGGVSIARWNPIHAKRANLFATPLCGKLCEDAKIPRSLT